MFDIRQAEQKAKQAAAAAAPTPAAAAAAAAAGAMPGTQQQLRQQQPAVGAVQHLPPGVLPGEGCKCMLCLGDLHPPAASEALVLNLSEVLLV